MMSIDRRHNVEALDGGTGTPLAISGAPSSFVHSHNYSDSQKTHLRSRGYGNQQHLQAFSMGGTHTWHGGAGQLRSTIPFCIPFSADKYLDTHYFIMTYSKLVASQIPTQLLLQARNFQELTLVIRRVQILILRRENTKQVLLTKTHHPRFIAQRRSRDVRLQSGIPEMLRSQRITH